MAKTTQPNLPEKKKFKNYYSELHPWNRIIRFIFVFLKGHGGGQVVSVLALYSNNLSLNLVDAYSFFCKIC